MVIPCEQRSLTSPRDTSARTVCGKTTNLGGQGKDLGNEDGLLGQIVSIGVIRRVCTKCTCLHNFAAPALRSTTVVTRWVTEKGLELR